MKTMNFYTQNGWAGSNYDSKLSTKEIAAKVRAFAKKNFPGFKFSVRSERSMYTDSMYIELKEGTCLPFVEGSRSAERGYMDTMNTVKGWEKELTPEMFKALDAVTIYANSFRYDDSDGMQDYFDTNFYLKIKVSDEYKVIEPKAKKSSIKPEKAEEAKEVEAVTVKSIEVVDYSEKAIAMFGDTKAIKEQLKELGGRFNPSLKHNGEKRAGWIFSKKQTDKVRLLLSEQKETNEPVKRGKSLQDIIDQTRRLNDNAGRNWYWSFKREKLINAIYTTYVANIGKLGAYSEPNKKFSKEEYTGLIRESETKDTAPVKATNEEPQGNDTPLIIADYAKYDSFDYLTTPEELDGFRLGEVVYDQCGEIGVILAFNEKGGTARVNSNGCCDVGRLKKCPKEIAEKEVERMDIMRPEKALTACTVEAYPLENIYFIETDNLNSVCYYDVKGAGIIR